MATDSESSSSQPTLLVPVLDLTPGAPDPVALGTWHMALSSLIGADLPHQLFALWVFPERGGVILVGPDALAEDHLPVPTPEPHLGQDQLFELEDTLRRAKYASAAAVPVRTPKRDVGLILVGTFEAGVYGAGAARILRQLAHQLAAPLEALGRVVVAPNQGAEAGADDQGLTEAFLAVVEDAPTGAELVRRLSGVLHPHVPHDRLEVVAFAGGAGRRFRSPGAGAGGGGARRARPGATW